VTKATTPTVDQVIQQAREHAAATGATVEEALITLVEKHKDRVHTDAYKKFRTTPEAIQTRLTMQQAWTQARPTSMVAPLS
jgi:hypothetical protein